MINVDAVKEHLTSTRELLSRGLVDRSIYVDPDIYKLEQQQIFAKSWLMVGHESQIPNPGDFVESYMGEDSVIMVRDMNGKVNVLLNTCRHRGNKVCRAEAGNTNTWMCQYHGWTYDTTGAFVGAPHFEEIYKNDIDPSEWGLKRANVGIYKELVFATFVPNPISLEDFLGDSMWLLDMLLDPRPGGVEVAGGYIRWMVHMNWKFGAENSGGDTYHGITTHASAQRVGHVAAGNFYTAAEQAAISAGWTMVTPEGHIANGGWIEPGGGEMKRDTPWSQYLADRIPDTIAHLGELRATGVNRYNANIFPNAGFHTSGRTIHLLHPKGPNLTEVWMFPLVDKDAPEDVKSWIRQEADHHFGPAGFFEEDDGENWEQSTAACRSPIAATLPFNIQMGFGREKRVQRPGAPEFFEGQANEYGQQGFLSVWHERMLSSD